MTEGTIKTLNDRGYGFIQPDNGGKNIFFHASSLQGVQFSELYETQRVSFTLGEGPRGPCAENVKVV